MGVAIIPVGVVECPTIPPERPQGRFLYWGGCLYHAGVKMAWGAIVGGFSLREPGFQPGTPVALVVYGDRRV